MDIVCVLSHFTCFCFRTLDYLIKITKYVSHALDKSDNSQVLHTQMWHVQFKRWSNHQTDISLLQEWTMWLALIVLWAAHRHMAQLRFGCPNPASWTCLITKKKSKTPPFPKHSNLMENYVNGALWRGRIFCRLHLNPHLKFPALCSIIIIKTTQDLEAALALYNDSRLILESEKLSA